MWSSVFVLTDRTKSFAGGLLSRRCAVVLFPLFAGQEACHSVDSELVLGILQRNRHYLYILDRRHLLFGHACPQGQLREFRFSVGVRRERDGGSYDCPSDHASNRHGA